MFEATNPMYAYGQGAYGAQPQQQPMFYNNPQAVNQYQQFAQPKMTQVLTQEQINKLRNNGGNFDLRLSEEDILRAVCTHKDKNGQFTLIENPDGTVTCPICGKTFKMMSDLKIEDIQEAVRLIIDVLQTTKALYLNIPEETVSNYFQLIPLLEKLPQLSQLAFDDFNKYFHGANYLNSFSASNSGFNLFNNIVSPAGPGTMFGASMMPQPMMQPNMMAGPMGGAVNPFNMGMPVYQQQQQQPMMNGAMGNPFGYNGTPMMQPNIPQPQPAPQPAAAPQPGQTVEQTKTMNV